MTTKKKHTRFYSLHGKPPLMATRAPPWRCEGRAVANQLPDCASCRGGWQLGQLMILIGIFIDIIDILLVFYVFQ
jgi:hypothetical protein